MGNIKSRKKDPSVTVAVVGAVATIIVAVIGLVSAWIQRLPVSTTAASIPSATVVAIVVAPNATQSPFVNSQTPYVTGGATGIAPTSSATPSLNFTDTFADNHHGWDTGPSSDERVTADASIRDGALYNSLKSNDQAVDGGIRTLEIPVGDRKSFCLIFDARATDFSGDFTIDVLARVTNYSRLYDPAAGYYLIRLSEHGSDLILHSPGTPGSDLNHITGGNNISWSDKRFHTIRVSLQESEVKVTEGQTITPVLAHTLARNEWLDPDTGKIRLGTETFGPNQTVTAEFDNVNLYDRCP